MCGIAGQYQPGGLVTLGDQVDGMLDMIGHRGPDDRGIWRDPEVCLGSVRLAVLDRSPRGHMPMISADERWVLTYNGETYDFAALRARLERAGATFRSTGDTEVVLEHIAHHGVEATLAAIEGEWALAVWDRRERRLVLARDRHGVKPLYYRVDGDGTVAFASEVKALRGPGLRADETSVSAALLGLSVTWGEHTMLRGIRAVRPGERLVFAGSATPERRTFARIADWVDPALAAELAEAGEATVVDRVGAAFESAMDTRMVSDAPLACLVSGGVDSSLIAAMARKRHPDLQLYHADVDADSERPAAELLARELGLELRVATVTDTDVLDAIPAVTAANDIPLVYHLNSVPFYLVSQLARADGITVLLTGEGSDEYFLGYPEYGLAPVLEAVEAGKRVLRDGLHRVAPKAARLLWPRAADSYAEMLRRLVFRYEQELVGADAAAVPGRAGRGPAGRPGRGSVGRPGLGSLGRSAWRSATERRAQQATLSLASEHLVSLLHRNDRLGMAWSLESRFPFLAHGLAALAVNLPARYKLRTVPRLADPRHPFVVDKWVVRELAQRYVPPVLARRRKRGFPVSIAERLAIPPELFAGGFVAETYGLDRRALATLVQEGSRGWLTRLLLVEVWGRLVVGGETVDDIRALLRRHVRVAPARRS